MINESGGGKLKGKHYYRVEVPRPISEELQPYVAECADIIERLGLTFNEGNVFKAIWRLGAARLGNGKPGNTPEYDADKVAHYALRVQAQEAEKVKVNAVVDRPSDAWIKWIGTHCPVARNTDIMVRFAGCTALYSGPAKIFNWDDNLSGDSFSLSEKVSEYKIRNRDAADTVPGMIGQQYRMRNGEAITLIGDGILAYDGNGSHVADFNLDLIERVEPQEMAADGWIEWHGGDCPIEDDGSQVEIMFRAGRECTSLCTSSIARAHYWGKVAGLAGIVAYRIVKPAESIKADPGEPATLYDWTDPSIPRWADWIARDAFGRVYAYQCEPKRGEGDRQNLWQPQLVGGMQLLLASVANKPIDQVDWMDSLEARPK